MTQNPDQGSEPLTGDALMQADDATFAAELGLDIGTESAVETQAERPRDEKGRFTGAQQERTPEEEVAEDAAVDPDAEPAAEAEAEEEPADGEASDDEGEPEPEKPKPLTPFRVRTAEGEETEVPDIRLSFKAGGKDHEDVPLDKVVRWAQSGFHVEQVTREADAVRQQLPKYEAQLSDLQVALEDQRALNTRLLEDEGFWQQAAQRYAQANTPEQRLARERAALAAQQQQFEEQRLAIEAGTFLQNETLPRLTELATQYPTVTTEELVARLQIELTPLMRNGRVPREQWSQVQQLLDGPVRHYAEAQHGIRDGARATAETKARRQVTKAQEESTKAKRQLARSIAPGSSKNAPPKAKPVTNLDEAGASILDDVMADILGG